MFEDTLLCQNTLFCHFSIHFVITQKQKRTLIYILCYVTLSDISALQNTAVLAVTDSIREGFNLLIPWLPTHLFSGDNSPKRWLM